jgi:hypothetical protein
MFAIGIRLKPDDRLHIEATFGLADLFALRLRPNPRRKTVGFARTSADIRHGVSRLWKSTLGKVPGIRRGNL